MTKRKKDLSMSPTATNTRKFNYVAYAVLTLCLLAGAVLLVGMFGLAVHALIWVSSYTGGIGIIFLAIVGAILSYYIFPRK